MSAKNEQPVNLAGLALFQDPQASSTEAPKPSVRNRHFMQATGTAQQTLVPERPVVERPRAARRAAEPPQTTTSPAHSQREVYEAYQAEAERRRTLNWGSLDWGHVQMIQTLVADKISGPESTFSQSITEESATTQTDQKARASLEMRGRSLIKAEVDAQASAMFREGAHQWDDRYKELLAEGVFISQFRLGRLQLLLDLPEVEDIIIDGPWNIWLRRTSGKLERVQEQIASSNLELERMLQRYGQLNPNGARTISASNPMMNMTLPGGERLAAVMPPIDKNVSITIRKHNLIDIDLRHLIDSATVTDQQAELIQAAVLAGMNITIAGLPAAGKTTLARALCNVLPPEEPVATIEDVRELHLDLMSDRHHIVLAWQSVEGAGAIRQDGSRQGDIGLPELVYQSLRHSVRRIIVGEVRSKEILPMFEASRAGTGTLSTIHAEGADETIHRMAKLYMKAQPGTHAAIAYEEVGDNLDLVIWVRNHYDPSTGRSQRMIAEISEIVMGEKEARRWPVHKKIFAAGTNGLVARPTGTRLDPRNSERLLRWGFDDSKLFQEVQA
ncbi:ATPase, T2SS/T4P/T4SS family [Arthrobacter woluwensis]|uniref:ATPase, T2SS/T4P/T4SS family n=1 Tax=Arthrobacter woluwensis TaxID=156980 RepID=UPI0037F904F7